MMERTVETTRNDKLLRLEEEQKVIDRSPFRNMKIEDSSVLDTLDGRRVCPECYKSRKFFCYTCYIPLIDKLYIPTINLPVKIDIIKHAREVPGKSTAVHAAIIAPEDVTIYTYPKFPEILNKEETVLIFPSETATTMESLFQKKKEKNNDHVSNKTKDVLPIKRAIFIDSTWHQTKAIYKDQRLRELRCIILKSRISQFWRHQKESPRWYLATIEAIHQFLVELHVHAYGVIEEYADLKISLLNNEQDIVIGNKELNDCSELNNRYNGQYDNLLYFFKYMYDKIHTIYDHNKLLAYKRPLA